MHDRLRTAEFGERTAIAAPPRDVTVIMPTISWTGTFEPCARRVLEMLDASSCEAELVVAFDGEPPAPPAWLVRHDVRIVSTGTRSGPAAARNRAAAAARGEILFFVDADVELDGRALEFVHERLGEDLDAVGIFGTYDDEPAAPGTASQFRNLLHHHTHVQHPGPATTFWAGCGAIRRAEFLAAGGFDARYRVPCIEDIELGARMTSAGGRIELDPRLQCKHHKRWTVRSMVHTDITCRAIPWTKLMLADGRMPASLAIDWRSRASGILASLALVATAATFLTPWAWAAVAACLAGVLVLNHRFYRLCRRKRGVPFAMASFALHLLFFVYSSVTFGAMVLYGRLVGFGKTEDAPQPHGMPPSAEPGPAEPA